MKRVTFMSLLFIILLINPVYGQVPSTTSEMGTQLESNDSVFGVKPIISKILETIGNFGITQTDQSSFDPDKKVKIDKVIKSGVATGNVLFDLWFHFHEFIVNVIFAGSPVPIEKGMIVLISFIVTTIAISYLMWSLIKKLWKVVLILVGIIVILLVAGIQFPSF